MHEDIIANGEHGGSGSSTEEISSDSDGGVDDEEESHKDCVMKKLQKHTKSRTSDEQFMELVSRASIYTEWPIPVLHTKTRSLDTVLSKEAKKEVAEMGIPYRTGPFTPAEDKIIKTNWNEMCTKFNLPNCPQAFSRWRSTKNIPSLMKARRKALLYLGKNLEHRTLSHIYMRFKTSLGCTKKGRFTSEEEEIIEAFLLIKETTTKDLTYDFIGAVLGRDKHAIWRYMKRRNSEVKSSVVWNLQSTEKFLKLLMEEIKKREDIEGHDALDINILYHRKVPWQVWVNIAIEMDSYPLSLKVYWNKKLYVQLFAKYKIYLSEVRLKLIKILMKKEYTYWQDVKWLEVSEHFSNNYTPQFLWYRFYSMIRGYCILFVKNYRKCLEFLHNKFIIKNEKMNNRRLQRLCFNDKGKLHFKD